MNNKNYTFELWCIILALFSILGILSAGVLLLLEIKNLLIH